MSNSRNRTAAPSNIATDFRGISAGNRRPAAAGLAAGEIAFVPADAAGRDRADRHAAR
jgi:hypothetical protein